MALPRLVLDRALDLLKPVVVDLFNEARRGAISALAGAAVRRYVAPPAVYLTPLEAKLFCPRCSVQHIDAGPWAERPHHDHLCHSCHFIWRVEPYCRGVA